MNFVAVIPARFGSERLPGKPLIDIAGQPMIQHACSRFKSKASRVLVATDDQRIADAVTSFGGEYNNKDDHATEHRLAEVVNVELSQTRS